LASPLKTCTLTVERHDDLLILFLKSLQPKPGGPPGATEPVLFAQANMDLTKYQLSHFCDPVVDSSRYFCIRIEDAAANRTAHIGLGFRERDDASNFRLALQDYERSLERERVAETLHAKYEEEDVSAKLESQLTLKEGEKLHIQIKGRPVKEKEAKPKSAGGARPVLLRKPPPSAAASGVISGVDLELVEKTHMAASSRCLAEDDDDDAKTVDSGGAVNDGVSVEDDDDDFSRYATGDADVDEWNDFQDGEAPAGATM
jgi:adaptin ear-binding coat-associated protein 1/2